jgi:hypothetical protein
VRVALRCPASAGRRCKGMLRIERGNRVLGRRSFSIAADRTRSFSVRMSKRTVRLARRHAKVSVEVLTRGADGQLRRAVARMRLRR